MGILAQLYCIVNGDATPQVLFSLLWLGKILHSFSFTVLICKNKRQLNIFFYTELQERLQSSLQVLFLKETCNPNPGWAVQSL